MPPRKAGFGGRSRQYLIAGILTVIPIWITVVVFQFVLTQLSRTGRPLAAAISQGIGTHAPMVGNLFVQSWFQNILAVIITLLALYSLGWLAARVVGRRLIAAFDSLIDRIPVVQRIYGASKKLLSALQRRPDEIQRVVLIEFPTPGMKAVGFVTRVLTDAGTGEKLAAVYVPTTPNPTSGYLELIPVSRLTATDWTMDEAMTFIISGGAVAPATVHFRRGAGASLEPEPEQPSS